MKTILVPIQFEEHEKKLVKYGAYFSHQLNAQLLLYCPVEAFQPHHTVGGSVLVESMHEDFKAEKNKILKKYASWLVDLKPMIQESESIDLQIDKGVLIPSVINQAIKIKPELLIMEGSADGWFAKVSGDSNQHLLNSVKSPVCFIPKEMNYHSIERIAYLTSYKREHMDHMGNFLTLVKALHADLTIFHPKSGDDYQFELMKEGYIDKLNLLAADCRVKHIDINEEHKEKEIIAKIREWKIDLMVFFNEEQKIVKELIKGNLLDNLMEELKIPLLIYPE